MKLSKNKLNISVGKLYKNSFAGKKHTKNAGLTSASFSVSQKNSLLIQIRNRKPKALLINDSFIKTLVGGFVKSQRRLKRNGISIMIKNQLDSVRSELNHKESLQRSISSELLSLQADVQNYTYSIGKARILLGIMKTSLSKVQIVRNLKLGKKLSRLGTKNIELSRAFILEKSEETKFRLQQCTSKHERSSLEMRNSIMGDQLTSLLLVHKSLQELKHGLIDVAFHGSGLIENLFNSQSSKINVFAMLDIGNSQIMSLNSSKSRERRQIIEEIKKKNTESRLIEERLKTKIRHIQIDLNESYERMKSFMMKHNTLMGLYIEVKQKIKNIYEQTSQTEADNKEKLCKFCQKLFWEKKNFNWSCCFHPSEWNGNMYWCCGKLDMNHPGCTQNKHISHEEDEMLDLFASGNLSQKTCSSCRQLGHTNKQCPNDPNFKVKSCRQPNRVLINNQFIDNVIKKEDDEDTEDLLSLRTEISLKRFFSNFREN